MATPDRPPLGALAPLDGLEAAAYRFDPFEALRRIECAYPERPRLGASARPADDAIRIHQTPSLGFAPAALVRYRGAADSCPGVLEQYFFGLFGPNGPMPLHLTDYAHDRLHNHRDSTFAAFADIFHNRFAALLYRAWATSRPAVSGDRPEDDRFSDYMDSLIGLGQPAMRERDRWPDAAKRFFAGRLASAARGPEGLEAVLVDFFALPMRIEEYAGEWVRLGPDVQMRLGAALGLAESPGAGCGLGVDTIIGEAAWSAEHRFSIVAGPLDREQFLSFLPTERRLAALASIVRNYTADELAWELVLLIRARDVPATRLGEEGILGWTSWLAPDGTSDGRVRLQTNDVRPGA